MTESNSEERYRDLLLAPLEKCAMYRPQFGADKSGGVSLQQFRTLYGADPFYHWIGLDSDLMYAAHKAAGGMTSIYRQLGTGCELLIRAIVQDAFGLDREQVAWSYEILKKDGAKAILTLDARIDLEHVGDAVAKRRVADWLKRSGHHLGIADERIAQLRGAVFEARQGYKSADAKRSNADLGFGMNAASANYLPVLTIVSTQASQSVVRRYSNSKMLVLTGVLSDDDAKSTFAFFRNVVGYDLGAFFERNAPAFRERCGRILELLLSADDGGKQVATAAGKRKRRRPPT